MPEAQPRKDSGACPGSQATPGAAEEASPPIGFDPARWSALREGDSWQFFGNGEPLCPHCGAHCSITDNEWWHLYSEDGPHDVECPSCDREFAVSSRANWSFSTDEQEAMQEEDAIAIEARQRTDPEEGLDPKGESAGPQDIAQGPSQ